MHDLRLTGLCLLACAAVAVTAPPAPAQTGGGSGPTAKPASQRHDRARAAPVGQAGQIVCTKYGCRPLPAHCRAETEYTFEGDPTGYQIVLCP